MAATNTAIANLALTRIGEQTVSDINEGTDTVSVKSLLIYTQALEELLTAGPELGWKFAKRRVRLDREAMTITAFADPLTGSTTTVTATHTLVAGDMVVIDGTTNYDGEYEVLTVTGTTAFSITKAFVADDATGTAYWTSEEYGYRFTMPTSLRIVSMQQGGLELTDWVREGVFLLTNQSDEDIDLVYVQSIITTTLFPSHFTRVLILKMAIQLIYALNQDLKAVQGLEYELDKAMNKAIAMDEREQYVKEYSSSWVDIGNTTDTLE